MPTHLRSYGKTYYAWDNGVARRLKILMYPRSTLRFLAASRLVLPALTTVLSQLLSKTREKKRTLHLAVACVALLCLYAQPGRAQEDEIAAGGRFQYQSHCAGCHGVNGIGDGRMAGELLSKPTDLTQLAKHNDGQFPFWKVYRVIDGREDVVAHGSRAMPIWGVWFQVTEGSELRATGRILELVHYLKSIQEK